MFKIHDEPEWPNEGACLGCMINRDGLLKIYDEPESPHEGACLKFKMVSFVASPAVTTLKKKKKTPGHTADALIPAYTLCIIVPLFTKIAPPPQLHLLRPSLRARPAI